MNAIFCENCAAKLLPTEECFLLGQMIYIEHIQNL